MAGQSNKIPPSLTEVWEPEPRVVSTGVMGSAPSDAIVLFDGTQTSAWQHRSGEDVKWTISDGIMTVKRGTGPIFTKEELV